MPRKWSLSKYSCKIVLYHSQKYHVAIYSLYCSVRCSFACLLASQVYVTIFSEMFFFFFGFGGSARSLNDIVKICPLCTTQYTRLHLFHCLIFYTLTLPVFCIISSFVNCLWHSFCLCLVSLSLFYAWLWDDITMKRKREKKGGNCQANKLS